MSTATLTQTTSCAHCGTDRETVAVLAAVDAGIDPAEAVCCQDGDLP